MRTTTYGRRDGTGKTKGRRASLYRATLPDGRVVEIRSYLVHVEQAAVAVYESKGTWYPNGAHDPENLPGWVRKSPYPTVPGERIQEGI